MTRILRKSFMTALICALFIGMAHAAEQPPVTEADEEEQQDELIVTADRMEMQLDGRTVELTGNVRVEDSAMSLTALKMMVYLTEAEKPAEKDAEKKEKKEEDKGVDAAHSNMKLQRIEADGEVVLRKLDGTESAMGDHAVYDVKDDTILMTGNCSIIQGKNTMLGDKVIYDRKKAKINIQKPRLTIQLDKKGGKNGGALGNIFGNKDDKDDKDDKNAKDEKDDKKEKDAKDEKTLKDDNAPKDKQATKDDKTEAEKPKEDKKDDVKPQDDKTVDTKTKEDKKVKKGFWTRD